MGLDRFLIAFGFYGVLCASAALAQPASYLRDRESHVVGKVDFVGKKIDLYAYMKPISAEKPVPVVVYVGGCSGWDKTGAAYMQEHIAAIESIGYHVVHLDWAGSRGIYDTCSFKANDPRYTKHVDIAKDMAIAFEYLSKYPKIDPERIGALGFSAGGGGVLAYSLSTWPETQARADKPGYKVLFAIYGFCDWQYSQRGEWTRNTMAVFGELDDEVRPHFCKVPQPRPGIEAVVHLFPGVHHGYMLSVHWPATQSWRDYAKKYVTLQYDPKAQQQTWIMAKQWFDKHLLKVE